MLEPVGGRRAGGRRGRRRRRRSTAALAERPEILASARARAGAAAERADRRQRAPAARRRGRQLRPTACRARTGRPAPARASRSAASPSRRPVHDLSRSGATSAARRDRALAVRGLDARRLRPPHRLPELLLRRCSVQVPIANAAARERVHADAASRASQAELNHRELLSQVTLEVCAERVPTCVSGRQRIDTSARGARAGRGEPAQPGEAPRGRHGDHEGPARLPDPPHATPAPPRCRQDRLRDRGRPLAARAGLAPRAPTRSSSTQPGKRSPPWFARF